MMAGEELITMPLAFESSLQYIPLGGDIQYLHPVGGDDPDGYLGMFLPPEEVSRLRDAEEAAMSLADFELSSADAERFTPPGPRLPRASAAYPNPFPSRLERLASLHATPVLSGARAPPPTRHAAGDGFGVFLSGGVRRDVLPVAAAPTAAADTSCFGKRKYEDPRGGDGGAESTECVICIEEFKVGDDLSTMPCMHRHRFHEKCLAKWLERSRSCPLCRHVLPAISPYIRFI